MMFLFFEFNIWYYGIDLIESESFLHLDGDLLLFPFLDFLAGITEGNPFRISSGQDTDEPMAFRYCFSTLKGWSRPADETVRE